MTTPPMCFVMSLLSWLVRVKTTIYTMPLALFHTKCMDVSHHLHREGHGPIDLFILNRFSPVVYRCQKLLVVCRSSFESEFLPYWYLFEYWSRYFV